MAEEKDIEKAQGLETRVDAINHPDIATEKDKDAGEISAGDGTEPEEDSNHSRHSSVDTIEPAPAPASDAAPRAKSRSSSVRSRPVSIVPRAQRRGLLARLTIIPEVDSPVDYRRSVKWTITFVVALAAAAAPMGSSIFYPALPELSLDLGATSTVTNLSVALYMLAMSIFPLWWSSFSETLGRRTIYIVSFALFLVWGILSAVSTSIGMLIVMRVLSGGAAASVQAVGAGTIADIWAVRERGRAMGIFYLGPLMGPLLAPIIGGALAQAFGWRSTQWFLAIYGAIIVVVLIFCLPETLTATKSVVEPTPPLQSNGSRPDLSRVSTRQSVQKQAKTTVTVLKRWFYDPLTVIKYLRFPVVALTVYYAAITFGSLYVLNISIQQTFSEAPYNFSTSIVGLFYIPNSLGYMVASIFGGHWSDRIMHRSAMRANRYDDRGKLIFIPEDRMRENVWISSAVYPAALIWYGWSVHYALPWPVAAVANFFFGLGSMIVFSVSTTMLTEFMPRKSSSGVALNNFIRNILSCIGGVVASPLIDAIGNGWLFTGLGLLCAISGGLVTWAIKRWGPRWRPEMDRRLNA